MRLLTRSEADAIDARVAALEATSGVQVVVALVGKADAYAELPWKAFALGASLAALVIVAADVWRPDWVQAHAALKFTVAVLGAGAVSALAAIFVPAYARLYLRRSRRDAEVRQYAQALFLERELFRARERTGVLLLVSLFERKIEVLPDVGFADRVTAADWREVVQRMVPLLRDRRPADAVHEGLDAFAGILVRRGFHPAQAGAGDEIPNRPIQRKGA